MRKVSISEFIVIEVLLLIGVFVSLQMGISLRRIVLTLDEKAKKNYHVKVEQRDNYIGVNTIRAAPAPPRKKDFGEVRRSVLPSGTASKKEIGSGEVAVRTVKHEWGKPAALNQGPGLKGTESAGLKTGQATQVFIRKAGSAMTGSSKSGSSSEVILSPKTGSDRKKSYGERCAERLAELFSMDDSFGVALYDPLPPELLKKDPPLIKLFTTRYDLEVSETQEKTGSAGLGQKGSPGLLTGEVTIGRSEARSGDITAMVFHEERLYIGSTSGLTVTVPSLKKNEWLEVPLRNVPSRDGVSSIVAHGRKIYISFPEGVFALDIDKQEFTKISTDPRFIGAGEILLAGGSGCLWAVTENYIINYDYEEEIWKKHVDFYDLLRAENLSTVEVTALAVEEREDSDSIEKKGEDDTLILALRGFGLVFIYPCQERYVRPKEIIVESTGQRINLRKRRIDFIKSNADIMWLGLEAEDARLGAQLLRHDKRLKRTNVIDSTNKLVANSIFSLIENPGTLYIGTDFGLYIFHQRREELKWGIVFRERVPEEPYQARVGVDLGRSVLFGWKTEKRLLCYDKQNLKDGTVTTLTGWNDSSSLKNNETLTLEASRNEGLNSVSEESSTGKSSQDVRNIKEAPGEFILPPGPGINADGRPENEDKTGPVNLNSSGKEKNEKTAENSLQTPHDLIENGIRAPVEHH